VPSSDTQFKPGQSGNPKGRKKGECQRYRLFKEIVEPHTPTLVRQAIDIALSDSKDRTKILAIFLERVLPAVIKDNILEEGIELKGATLLEQATHIVTLINDKSLTPTQANELLASIKTTADIKYRDDLEKEVEALKTELNHLKQQLKR
jgi:hypothetical protein